MPERTESCGATAPPRRRQGSRGHAAALESALKIVEARKSVVMKPRRPSPGRRGCSDAAPLEAPGEVGGTRGRRAWRDEACGPPAQPGAGLAEPCTNGWVQGSQEWLG